MEMDAVRGLLNFIADARTKGMTDEEITDAANSIGRWEPSLVRAAVLGVDLTHLTNDPEQNNDTPDLVDEHDSMAALDEYPDRTESSTDTTDTREETHTLPSHHDAETTADWNTSHTDTPDPAPQARTGVGAVGYGAAGAYSASSAQATAAANTPAAPEPKLPVLQAVIHHVSLWIFLLSSIPTIIYLVHYLMEDGGYLGDTSTLTTMASILLVTGGFYGIMYGLYLRRANREPGLSTGKVLSIITLAGSTVGLIGSIITFIAVFLATVVFGDEAATSVLTSSALVIAVFLMTILTYFSTDFMQRNDLQPKLTVIAPIITGVILVSLFILAFIQLPSVAEDKRTQSDLVDTAEAIVDYTEDHRALPTEEDFKNLDTPSGITYKNPSHDQYELCATFNNDTLSDYMRGDTYPMYDDTVSEWSFDDHAAGEHCFKMRSNTVHEYDTPPYEPLPYPMPSVPPHPEPTNYPTIEPQPEPTYSFEPAPQPEPTYTTMPIEPTIEPALS